MWLRTGLGWILCLDLEEDVWVPTWELVWGQSFHKAGASGRCPLALGLIFSFSAALAASAWNRGVLALLPAGVGSGAQRSPQIGILPPPKQNFLKGSLACWVSNK